MYRLPTTIAVFSDRAAAQAAVNILADSGFHTNDLSLVGNGHHSNRRKLGFGLGSLDAALTGIGIPRAAVHNYETDIKAGRFLVMAGGNEYEVVRAKTILSAAQPARLDVFCLQAHQEG
jgi:hypothetical protein